MTETQQSSIPKPPDDGDPKAALRERLAAIPAIAQGAIRRWSLHTGLGRVALARNLEKWQADPDRVGRYRKAWWTWVGLLACQYGTLPPDTPVEALAETAKVLRTKGVWTMGPRVVATLCAGQWPVQWAHDLYEPAKVVADPSYPPPRTNLTGGVPLPGEDPDIRTPTRDPHPAWRSSPGPEDPRPNETPLETSVRVEAGMAETALPSTGGGPGAPAGVETASLGLQTPVGADESPSGAPEAVGVTDEPPGPPDEESEALPVHTVEVLTNPGPEALLTDRDQRLRAGRITSSVVPYILGLKDRYGTPITVWMGLTGRSGGWEDSEIARMGRRYEAPARDEYLFQHPELACHLPGTVLHPTVDWAADTPDGICYRDGEPVHVLEIKHRMSWKGWGHHMTEVVPPDVWVQCVWHMWVNGLRRCDVWAIRALETRLYPLRQNDRILGRVVELVEQWRARYVVTDTMPPADGSDTTRKALLELFREPTGEVLPVTPAVADLVKVREQWKGLLKARRAAVTEAENVVRMADNALLAALGPAHEFEGLVRRKDRRGSVSWKGLATHLGATPDQIEQFRGTGSHSVEVVK